MSEYKLVWQDEFEIDGKINLEKWRIDIGRGKDGWGNGESQYYTDNERNVFVKDGKLNIVALNEHTPDHNEEKVDGAVFGRNYTSAKITTYGIQSWKYGRFEIKARVPKGFGTWPAIWLMPDSYEEGEPWPNCGEIDIMEHLGKNEGVIHHSLHTGKYHFQDHDSQYTIVADKVDATKKSVLYSCEWTENHIEFFLDDISVGKLRKGQENRTTDYNGWPFDKPFYLIINLAIGGYWGATIDQSIFPAVMEVDYVRVYQK